MLTERRVLAITRLIAAGILVKAAELPAQTAINPKWALWLQPAGLRGANAAVIPKEQPSYADFVSLRQAGANFVVLSAYGIQRITPPYADDASAALNLANAVQRAERAGLWVVIAIRTGPGLEDVAIESRTPGLQSKLWVDSTARHAFFQMWQRIASVFGQDLQVIGYDVIVEPLPEAAVEGLNMCCASNSDTALAHRGIDWPAIADTIAMAIRKSDTLTPVLVGATGFALPPFFANLRPIHDKYVVYDVHQYEPHAYTHQGNPGLPVGLTWPGGSFPYWRDKKQDTLNVAWLHRVLAPVLEFQRRAAGSPVLVGEFGVNRQAPGAPSFIAAETALFDSLGWHGAMWTWNCCGAMAVSPRDSAASDLEARSILATYRDYWNRSKPGDAGRPAN